MLADPGEHHRAQPVPQGAADVVLRALEVPVEVDPDAELHHRLPPTLVSRTARMSRVSLLVGHDMGHGRHCGQCGYLAPAGLYRVKAQSSDFAAQLNRSERPLTSPFVIPCCPLLSPKFRRATAPARPTGSEPRRTT